VLHVAKRFWPYAGGQERYVLDLARAQVLRGHACRVVTPDRDLVAGSPGTLPPRDRRDGIDIRRVRAAGGPAKQFVVEPPTTLFRAVSWADVVHHHDPRFAFETTLLLAALLRKPVIVHTHGLLFHTDRATGLKRFLMRRYYGPVFRRATATVVAGSRIDEAAVAELGRVGPDRLRYVPHGIDVGHFSPRGSDIDTGSLLVVGRIARHKGHDRALEVLARLDPRWHLAIAGVGAAEEMAALAAQARALTVSDRVHWLGSIRDEDLPALLERAQLVLFPSRFEGFGLALLEALASGAAVLASRIRAHEEILSGKGLDDRLVDFDRPADVAARIALEAARPPEEGRALRSAGVERATAFSLERMVGEIDDLYLGLEASGRLRPSLREPHRSGQDPPGSP
jgi:glycosyltransferase involved in cell wall biosynthesis